MILRFCFSNFRSFCSEQELSMVAGSSSELPGVALRQPAGKESVLPVAAIYGANASGKTNVLRALAFVAHAIERSHRGWRPDGGVPREPFRLNEEGRKAPSRFSVDVVISGTRYQYGFSVTTKRVQEEWLYAYPNGRKQAWFNRRSEKPIEFSSKLAGENKAIEALTRPNSLYLSAAAQNNHELLTPIYNWFVNSLTFVTSERFPYQRLTAALCDNDQDRKRIVQLLRSADLGIADLRVNKKDTPERAKKVMQALVTALELKAEEANEFLENAEQSTAEFELLHKAGARSIPFSVSQESDGTVAYLSILGPMLNTLRSGGILCIDELDASLHPLLAMEIIKSFSDPDINTAGSQLIFNTHDSNLLNSKLLRRDQIWFTEKRRDGASQLYPLTDFRPRSGENIESGYLQGRYGAIPFLNSDSFLSALHS